MPAVVVTLNWNRLRMRFQIQLTRTLSSVWPHYVLARMRSQLC